MKRPTSSADSSLSPCASRYEDSYREMAFEDWVRAWFDHPDDWDWMNDHDLPYDLSPAQTIAYATRLFETAGATLAPYSDHQIGQSLRPLVGGSDSSLYALWDESVSAEDRIRCLSSILGVYEQVFAPRCMERALALPNVACQESAIHGLGHWQESAIYGVEQRRETGDERALNILDTFTRLRNGTAARTYRVCQAGT